MHTLTPSLKSELEKAAVTLARMAGERIRATPRDGLTVRFKSSSPGRTASSPVCDVDREVETQIRRHLQAQFPSHAIVGEEGEDLTPDGAEFVWVIDPLDGTTNYLSGLPLYAASIGVLWRERPVAGAIWCAVTHELRPGIYHASEGGALHFDGVSVNRWAPGEWRGLASEPGRAPRFAALFETRVLASAALECAFVAAGFVQLAFLPSPRAWDVAAGIVLARAAGCRILTHADGGWSEFDAFAKPAARTLRQWRQAVLIAPRDAIERAVGHA